jgi:hypothetical protein
MILLLLLWLLIQLPLAILVGKMLARAGREYPVYTGLRVVK